MRRGICVLTCLTLLLGACTTTPVAPPVPDGLWQDQAFSYDATLVTVSTDSLFALDPDLLRSLRDGKVAATHAGNRSAHLLELVFGADLKAFAYAGGHSTVAAETWQNRRGDCLSLSIMSLALARALDLPAQVQEVRVPASFDRRGGVDFLNAHVNVLMRNDRPLRAMNRSLPAGDIVVDFEPQAGTRQRGTPLSDRAILSRYLNNIAAEHLAQGNNRLAYAHFKAAIVAEPAYAASYSNLAQLYQRAGLLQGAEALLRQALALNEQSDLALGSLHRLLLSQGRIAEAAVYEQRLLAQREQDPYYWLGLGLDQLQRARYPQAVAALERAQALTQGFEEVHRLLAVAYWRAGQTHRARDQLAILGALDRGEPSVALLSKKFNAVADPIFTP
jgi:tetratricopeptide (TPR) repeat protein